MVVDGRHLFVGDDDCSRWCRRQRHGAVRPSMCCRTCRADSSLAMEGAARARGAGRRPQNTPLRPCTRGRGGLKNLSFVWRAAPVLSVCARGPPSSLFRRRLLYRRPSLSPFSPSPVYVLVAVTPAPRRRRRDLLDSNTQRDGARARFVARDPPSHKLDDPNIYSPSLSPRVSATSQQCNTST